MSVVVAKEQSLLAKIYNFLARSMRYPDQDWLNDAYLEWLFGLLKELSWSDDLQELRGFVEREPDLLEALQVEHTRLFINAAPQVVAPPYGSVYMRGEGTLMALSTEKTRDFYRRHGFDLASDQEIADHLVCELEFLGMLAEAEKVEDEEVFLRKHFRPWFTIFLSKVNEGADLPFYRIMVKLIDFFTKEDE